MSNTGSKLLFYQDKPIFGVDIGFNTIKAMQIDNTGAEPTVIGYGVENFENNFISDGVINDHKSLAESAMK